VAAKNRCNPALNNPLDSLTSAQVSALNSLLERTSRDINAIRGASNSIVAITELVYLAQPLVSQAHKAADANVRGNLADQFNRLLPQIDQLAASPDFHRTSLLETDDLTDKVNQDSCVAAFNNTVPGDRAINKPQNNWATNSDVQVTADKLNAALI